MEQQRRDDIDAEKRRERREKEREEAKKRNPKDNEPRVTGDPRRLCSEPPMDRRPSDNDAHSSPYSTLESAYENKDAHSSPYTYNTLESVYENNDARQQENPYNYARGLHLTIPIRCVKARQRRHILTTHL